MDGGFQVIIRIALPWSIVVAYLESVTSLQAKHHLCRFRKRVGASFLPANRFYFITLTLQCILVCINIRQNGKGNDEWSIQ